MNCLEVLTYLTINFLSFILFLIAGLFFISTTSDANTQFFHVGNYSMHNQAHVSSNNYKEIIQNAERAPSKTCESV